MKTDKLTELLQRGVAMPKKTEEEIAEWKNEVFFPIIHAIRDESDTIPNIFDLAIEEKMVMLDILGYLTPIAKRDDVTAAYHRLCEELGQEPKH